MMQATFPTLETDRLILRGPQMSDLPAWSAFYMSDRSLFVRSMAPDANACWRTFAHVAGMWVLRGYGSFIFAKKDTPEQALGMTGPWHPSIWPEVELGWTVWSANIEGQGFAYEAAVAARRYAYDTLGSQRPVSYIDPQNARSIALAERLGCTLDPDAATPFPDKRDLVYRHPEEL